MSDQQLPGRLPPYVSRTNLTADVVSTKIFERRLKVIAKEVGADILTLDLEDLEELIKHLKRRITDPARDDLTLAFDVQRCCHYDNALMLRRKIISFKGNAYVVK